MADTAILLATFNAEDHLEELLDSLLAQTDRDFVIHYHDDGSEDATLRIMERYTLAHPDVFKRIFGAPTGSAKANFMYMLREVEADYYLFCDDDDVWLPEKVAKERAALIEAESLNARILDSDAQTTARVPTAVFCDLKVVDEQLSEISPTFFSYVDRNPSRTSLGQLLIENMAPGCSIMFNRPLRDLAIRLDTADLPLIDMHDGFIMALASAAGTISYVDMPLVLYRQTGGNEVGAVHEGFVGKLKRNLTNIFSGELRRNKRKFHLQAYNLARVLVKILSPSEGFSEDKIGFLEEFLKTESWGKLQKIRFYRRNNINKNSNNFWYYLWL